MKNKYLLFVLPLLCFSCRENDPQPGTYTKQWVLNIRDINASYSITGSTFKALMLENGRVLINEYSDTDRYLLEIDPVRGTLENRTQVQAGSISNLRKRKDGKILITNYNRSSESYSIGFYNEQTHGVDYFSSIDVNAINDPPNIRHIYPGDEFIYTHNPNIYYLSTEEVYLAKWDLNGSLIWRIITDPTKETKIAGIESVGDDHVLIKTVSNYENEGEIWKVAKISGDGTTVWHKIMNEYGDVFRVHENDQGDIFVLNKRAVSKHDQHGNLLWSTPLSTQPSGFIWSWGLPTKDGGIVFQYESQDVLLIKMNASGKITWQEKYWEKNEVTGGIGFLELPNGDLIVTSLNAFVTKYNLN